MADIIELRGRLGKVFESAFRVEDIAESLASFDAERPADDVRDALRRNRYRVAGVRESGSVTGYVVTADLAEGAGTCGDHRREFDDEETVSGDAPMSEAIRKLAAHDRLFVRALGKVGGIVTRTDLQKPAVRMWLFGMVTLIEMAFTRMIEALFPDDAWTRLVSPGRVGKAREILEQRRRMHQAGDLSLLDCLQFADKGQILAKDDDARRIVGFPSRKEGERVIKELAALRDSLAHSQDIIGGGWEVIVALAENLDEVLRVSSVFQTVRRSTPPV